MAKKYPSKYSNGKEVSAAQYITEVICEKKAQYERKDLHYRFWVSKEWSAYYRNQIASAHKLLKQFSETAIVKALYHDKASRIYSLRAPHLLPIIQEEQDRLDAMPAPVVPKIDRFANSVGKNRTVKKNSLDILRDIDNGN